MHDKKEIVPWGISILFAGLLMTVIVVIGNLGEKAGKNQDNGNAAIQNVPSTQAKLVALQDNMSGAAQIVMPAVVCVCKSIQNPGKNNYHLEHIGSGLIINPDGFIITSDQIISKNDDLKIVIYERSHFEQEVFEIGHNHIYDGRFVSSYEAAGLTVLKIEGMNLPVVHFSEDANNNRGDWCIAIWNKLGRKPSVTSGIICAINQMWRSGEKTFTDIIETSCKMADNSSGGALVNKWGEITGIIIGKGVAVPAWKAVMIANNLDLNVK